MTIRTLLLLLSLSASTAAQTRTGRINVGDAVINYELTGRGVAVVLVHGWANTLAIWDNRCAQHNPVNDYHGYRRQMRRLTAGPEVPV